MSFEHTPAEHIDNLFTAFTSLPACKTRSQSFVNWIEPIKNQSHSAIAWSKMDLMFVYIKCNDEVSLLVLEQDWWKSFYRPNRFAKSSNFSEQPVRSLNLSTDAKQTIKENLTLYRFCCERIVVCEKTRPKKQPQVFQKSVPWMVWIAKRITFAIQFFSWTNLKFFNVWLLDYSA